MSRMAKPLHILFVEDVEDDALLMAHHLGKAGFDLVHERVETAKAMRAALEEKTWDVILCDYKLPRFSVANALKVLGKSGLDLPFIVVSGTIGEEKAAYLMRAGADDLILKDNLARLVPAIEREMREAEVRRQKREAEEALRSSEGRLRGAVESLQEGFALFDADDRLVALNDEYRRLNPAAQETMEKGGTFEDILRANLKRGVLVEAIGREEEFIQERIEKHKNPKGPIIRRFTDGTVYMLQETRTPEGGVALTFIDITELKRAEEALQRRTHDLGERVKELTGLYSLSKIFSFSDISLEEGLQEAVEVLPAAWHYPEITCARITLGDVDYITKNFEKTTWRQASDIIIDEKRAGKVEVFYLEEKPEIDEGPFLKEERNLIDEIAARLGESIQRKKAEAQVIQAAKLATLGEMATSVAHELNQPLNVIRMAAGNVLRKLEKGTAEPAYLHDKLDRIAGQTERAAAIIDHMRMFGRKAEEKPAELDLSETMRNALELMGEQLRLAEIDVSLDLPEACPPVMGHPVQMEQVILNLLTNARDAVMANGTEKKITLAVDGSGDDRVRITVTDSGGGIPPNAIEHLFEPFFTTKEMGEGTGLGLSVSYGIIHDMGGTIEAENVAGGARFTITLPVAGTDADNRGRKTG